MRRLGFRCNSGSGIWENGASHANNCSAQHTLDDVMRPLEPVYIARRSDLVRAVLAQQWMAMIQMRLSLHALGDLDRNGDPMVMEETMWRLKLHEEMRMPNLLCAVDVVAEMLGEA